MTNSLLALSAGLGLPNASSFAPRVDALFDTLLVASLVLFGGLTIAVLWFLYRYREGSPADRSPIKLSTGKIEATWTIATTVIFVGIFFWGAFLYLDMERPPADAFAISVTGRQWMWDVRYPDGRREFNAVHVVVGKPVCLLLSSEDVIHSFFVPAFRLKQDVVPGKQVTAWFKPTRTGDYRLLCAQYCGTAHSQMLGEIIVMDPADYAAWLRLPPESGGTRSIP